MNKLLLPSLFNALPGLLGTEYKSLVSAVKQLFDQCPQPDDVRSLTKEELAKEWVFDELVDIWRKGLCYLELPEGCGPNRLGTELHGRRSRRQPTFPRANPHAEHKLTPYHPARSTP
jgi:hypothetical protein